VSAPVTAPAAAIDALLDGDGPIPETLDAAGGVALDPRLVAGLAAARDPAYRVWTEGIEPTVTVLGDRSSAVLITDAAAGRRHLLGLTWAEAPLAVAGVVDLGPRPAPEEPAVCLPPPAMAELIGRRQAHGHGLEPARAAALQRRLERGVRHWSVRRARPDGEGGQLRRNVEVVEGDGGIWRVRVTGEDVELAPTTSTAVLRELVALFE